MGLFDFVKNAGAKIGIGKSTKEEAAEKAAEDAADARSKAAGEARAEAMESRAEARKSVELEQYVKGLGLEVAGLDIQYDDNKATITGTAGDDATREKVILAVGNVEGVGQVDDQMKAKSWATKAMEAAGEAAQKAAAEKASSKFYTVVSGDSLSKIAKEFYGDPMKYPDIFEANKPMLKDPDLIYPGQVLRIPGVDSGGDEPDTRQIR